MNETILSNKIYIKAFFGDFREVSFDKALDFIRKFLYSCPHNPSEETINSKNLKGITLKELLPEEEYSRLQDEYKRYDEWLRKKRQR